MKTIIQRYVSRMAKVAWLLIATAGFSEEAFSPNLTFDQAHKAYVAGNYAEARRGYMELIEQQYDTKETWYNLANVAFHDGQLGEAVLNYRRAWFLDPRDPDVMANLQLVLQRTGANAPEISIIDRIGQELNVGEWKMLMISGYWVAMVCAALGLFVPMMRRFAKPIAVTGALAGLIGLGGWLYWKQWVNQREAVVIRREQTALYEPRPTATPYFALPEGSIVRIEDTFDSWIKISSNGRIGWVMKSAAERVYPWHHGEKK